MKALRFGLLVTALMLTGPALAAVSLPAVIGDHMVLQQKQPVPIWGWADPNEVVTVTLGRQRLVTKADAKGAWQVKLRALRASATPVTMTVIGSSGSTNTIRDILVGEVWLGSGQSNMQWSMTNSEGAPEFIAGAKFPEMRLFTVPMVVAVEPQPDVKAQWVVCRPETVAGFSAVLYQFGRKLHEALHVPVGLIASAWGGTPIQPWTPREGFAMEPALTNEVANIQASPGSPTAIYNAMIHPLIPFAIRGVIWYQGESNAIPGDKLYTERTRAMILGWRKLWGQGDFPFYYVQIAPYVYQPGNPQADLPRFWEQQTKAMTVVPQTGMVVIHDITGNPGNIHPPNKHDVGRRLAQWALAKDYKQLGIVYSGPFYKSARIQGNQIRITFDQTSGGLASRDDKPLTWFTIAGDDQKFVEAQAEIVGNSVIVSSPQIAAPQAVRFGWDQVAMPNLMNKAGLPAAPFRTDTW